jgi:hypothetical protein
VKIPITHILYTNKFLEDNKDAHRQKIKGKDRATVVKHYPDYKRDSSTSDASKNGTLQKGCCRPIKYLWFLPRESLSSQKIVFNKAITRYNQ